MEYSSKVYILIVNWNGWADTIECLESVFRSNYPNYQVIVCDNDSQDNSIEHIKAWADGTLNVYIQPIINPLRKLSFPPVPKPIAYVEYDRAQAERGGLQNANHAPLVIIKTGANLGFAGGNNVGLRYALNSCDFKFVWLLNNDTVVESYSLETLVSTFMENIAVGMCGSTIMHYNRSDVIQAQGGARFNKWLGVGNCIGYCLLRSCQLSKSEVVSKLKYIHGASMLVSRAFLNDIGLMNESYFLYYEEMDWAVRGSQKYTLGYSEKSVVYHKEGASIGSKFSKEKGKQLRSEYYYLKNRIKFTKTHYPFALPTVIIGIIFSFFIRLMKLQFYRAYILMRVIWCISFNTREPNGN